MRSVSTYQEYDMPKPLRKWPLFAMIGVVVALLAGCIVAFWHANGRKYEEAVTLAREWNFKEADRLAGVLLPSHEDLPQLKSFIDAGLMMEAGAYEESKRILGELGDYLNAQELYKECGFRFAQRMFELERYEEARELLLELGTYGEAQLWADESAYRIGIGYYTELADAVDPEQIVSLAQNAIQWFSGVTNHENAAIMLDRTSAYMYSLGIETFDGASLLYNATSEPVANAPQEPAGTLPEEPEEGAPEEGGDTQEGEESAAAPQPQEGGAAGEAPPTGTGLGQAQYLEMFQDAAQYFEMIPTYMDSGKYLEIIDLLGLPEEETALKLREEYWEFAPARKFVLGKYIAQFFHGKWSGGGYGIDFTEIYHFYMLNPEDGSGSYFGSGGISTNSSTGWKTAYSFRVLGKDNIEVIGAQTYTLTRAEEEAPPPDGQEQAGEAGQTA